MALGHAGLVVSTVVPTLDMFPSKLRVQGLGFRVSLSIRSRVYGPGYYPRNGNSNGNKCMVKWKRVVMGCFFRPYVQMEANKC